MDKFSTTIIDPKGEPLAGVSVYIYLTGTATLAALYEDDGTTPKGNPLTTDGLGFVQALTPNSKYDFQMRVGDTLLRELNGKVVYDPTDEEDYELGSAALEDVGTGPGNVVQLDGGSKLPAVDGSQLTNMPASGTLNMRVFTSNNSWNVPANVTRIKFRIWGGGASSPANVGFGAPGGGAGEYAEGYVNVTPAETVTITIGAATGAPTGTQNGIAGNASSIASTTTGTITANGGSAANHMAGFGSGAGGAGGTGGGNGNATNVRRSPGGDGQGAYSTNGVADSVRGTSGGDAVCGGQGGKTHSSTASRNGFPGAVPGGGGGGGTQTANGGPGARGEVIIEF